MVTVDVLCGNVFIPNVFSPNGDGHDDYLFVRGDCITNMTFVVFDRWGNKVFESTSLSKGWDGTYNGQPMNTGSYIWYLKATLKDGATIERKGDVTLVR
jgi:gliding motility-associated-like protein